MSKAEMSLSPHEPWKFHDPQEIIDEVVINPARKVKLAVTDIDGVLRGKVVHLDKFQSIVKEPFGFCDVIFGWDSSDVLYEKANYTGWHTGFPDTPARLDLATYRKIPWEENTPFFLADLEDEKGNFLSIAPRSLLRTVRKRALDAGFHPFFSQEFEWFNFRETSESVYQKNFQNLQPLTRGMFGYSILRASQQSEFFTALFDQLEGFGVPLEGLHTETGPGVYEAAILYDDVLEAADRATLFKAAVKEIGHRHGVIPSFMAKWNKDLPGCSGHLHQSLWDLEGSCNCFYDASDPKKMSETMQSYLEGVLHCLPYVLPMYAPTVNSFKRLVEGHWAPTQTGWGMDNRTVAARVLAENKKATRLELRVVGSDANPYLAMAASLASGLYGIEKKLKLNTAPIQGNGYAANKGVRLASNLKEAVQVMESSPIATELFGKPFVAHFLETRRWEWQQYMEAVTDWEFKRYFEII